MRITTPNTFLGNSPAPFKGTENSLVGPNIQWAQPMDSVRFGNRLNNIQSPEEFYAALNELGEFAPEQVPPPHTVTWGKEQRERHVEDLATKLVRYLASQEGQERISTTIAPFGRFKRMGYQQLKINGTPFSFAVTGGSRNFNLSGERPAEFPLLQIHTDDCIYPIYTTQHHINAARNDRERANEAMKLALLTEQMVKPDLMKFDVTGALTIGDEAAAYLRSLDGENPQ
jgi:hypothetical protein